MKALDTNVIVRFVTQDDHQQSARANRYIELCLINLIVLCEMIWVLESAYHYPKAAILDLFGRMLSTSQFEIENKEVVWAALEDFKNSRADFSDSLVGRLNQRLGCGETASFDSAVKTLPGFRLL
jgi:predicted nucleic-acid-binding protein